MPIAIINANSSARGQMCSENPASAGASPK